jgi:NAD(P)-dependent dehydrogenase (short-subunit alcohol dehydrogenase family)
MKKFNNKRVVITGGNSGIGLAAAKEFIQEGARVIIMGRDKRTLDAAVAELGAQAVGVQGDITSTDDLDRLFSEAKKQFGQIDVLFANAGVALFAPFEQTDEKLFNANFEVNVRGSFLTAQKALALLADKSSIIFNTSVVGVKGFPGTSAYSASKAALRSLVRTLASELLTKGVRVNAVSPGPIETPIFGRLGMPEEALKEMAQGFEASNPMKRFGQPSEVAKAVLFFASEDSSYITGAELAVDGGLTQL